MAERRKTIKDQAGNDVSGVVVDVVESVNRYSDLKLADDTVLRVQVNAVDALRVDDKWDNDGNPVYILRSGTILSVHEAPEELRRKVQ